jgi:DNA-binding MarR family transcriptional regulator
MLESFVLLSGLSILTLAFSILYARRIRDTQKRYLQAKNALKDIILSFNRQVEKQGDQLEAFLSKFEALSGRQRDLTEVLEDHKGRLRTFAGKVDSLSNLRTAATRIDALERNLNNVNSMKDTLTQKIVELENQLTKQKETETEIETAIPIRRDRALAFLTETELTVLEFLALEGEKTAPQIRDRTGLSREHTARLMKKLYEKGYLERRVGKTPFTYRLKEEMQKLLKKTSRASSDA